MPLFERLTYWCVIALPKQKQRVKIMLYGYTNTDGLGASVVPVGAQSFDCLESAKDQFESEAKLHFSVAHQPLLMWLFKGEPDGDEDSCGYPDFPDFLLRAECNDFNADILITEEAV